MSKYSLMRLRTISTALQFCEVMASHNGATLFFFWKRMQKEGKERDRERDQGEA